MEETRARPAAAPVRRDVLVDAEHVDEEAGSRQPSALAVPFECLDQLAPVAMPRVHDVVRGGEEVRVSVPRVREPLMLALLHEAPVALLRRLRQAPLQRARPRRVAPALAEDELLGGETGASPVAPRTGRVGPQKRERHARLEPARGLSGGGAPRRCRPRRRRRGGCALAPGRAHPSLLSGASNSDVKIPSRCDRRLTTR